MTGPPYTPAAPATCPIVAPRDTLMTLAWSGTGETQGPNYELMSLNVDGGLVGSAHAPGGQLGCAAGMSPVASDPPPPQQVLLEPGPQVLFIDATTNDPLYHFGAQYRFDLSSAPAPGTAGRKASTEVSTVAETLVPKHKKCGHWLPLVAPRRSCTPIRPSGIECVEKHWARPTSRLPRSSTCRRLRSIAVRASPAAIRESRKARPADGTMPDWSALEDLIGRVRQPK